MSVTASPRTPAETRLDDYCPPPFEVTTVELLVELFDDHALVTSTVGYRRHPEGQGPLRLDGEDLQLVAVNLDGRLLDDDEVSRADGRLTLTTPDDEFVLQVVTRTEPQNNTQLSGLYRSGAVFCTQMEAEGFRRMTFFQDRPDVLGVYTTTVVADAATCPTLLANGNLIDSGEGADGRHFATWHDPHPKPCYLFALVAGDLAEVRDRFTTCSGREVTLRLFVDKGCEDRTDHAMASLKRSMAWDEEAFGREYDLDVFMIVAVSDFNMGAMENKGLNIFNSALVLARPETSTDGEHHRIEGVIGHEYFHNWSGNRVTCRDWFQLSLKEGFTVFRDQEFSSDMSDRVVQRIADVRHLRATQFPEDNGPLAHPVRPRTYISIDNFYTTTIYEKGAEVIRMMHALLGPERFRAGSDLYFGRHDGEAATVEQFVACMEEAGGIDLSRFSRWYEQAGTPVITARGRWDAASRSYELVLEQRGRAMPGRPAPEPFHIPVRMGLVGPDGSDLPLLLEGEDPDAASSERVVELTEGRTSLRFVDLPAEPVPSLFRGFSAPVRLDIDLPAETLAFLARHDRDAFNRWEAGQRLMTDVLLELTSRATAGQPLETPEVLSDLFGHLLSDEGASPAVLAEMLWLPGLGTLGNLLDPFDVDAAHAARTHLKRCLARAHVDALRRRHAALAARSDRDGHSREAVAHRALKNVCLAMLTATEEDEALQLALDQMRNAGTMTDELGALHALIHTDHPARDEAVAAFRERWRGDDLVMNKWIAAQAASQAPDTLERVRSLAADGSFDWSNPNKVRSLWRTFADNLPRFHAADGSGYEAFADVVLAHDGRNAILAGRLVAAFNSWRRQVPARQVLMRAQLDRILETPSLSPNVYEMVTRTLA